MVTRLSSKRCNRFVVLLLDDEMFFSLLFEVVFTKVKRVQTTDVRFEVVRSARCVDLFVFLHDAAEGTESRDNTEFKKTEITDTGKIRWIRDPQCQF